MSRWLGELYEINGKFGIWNKILRKAKKAFFWEEVGRRALVIKDLNKKRVALKNRIAEETGRGFKDIKMNHALE